MSLNESSVFINGPAGNVETVLTMAEYPAQNMVGIICHPHPLYSGTMQNKVVTTIARTFHDLGVISVRFNFRGVGQSQGSYAEGEGETDDTLAVINWAKQHWPNHALWLAGFSFGAYVSLQAALAYQSIQQLITIAPPVNHFTFPHPQLSCPWIVVVAEQDTVVPANEVYQWIDTLKPKPEALRFAKATHFFDGELVNFRQQLYEKLKYAHAL